MDDRASLNETIHELSLQIGHRYAAVITSSLQIDHRYAAVHSPNHSSPISITYPNHSPLNFYLLPFTFYLPQCHLKILIPAAKVIIPIPERIRIFLLTSMSPAPSFIIKRTLSTSMVSGNTLI